MITYIHGSYEQKNRKPRAETPGLISSVIRILLG